MGPEHQSLDDIQEEFYGKMKHRPRSVKQMLAYCHQNNHTGHDWHSVNQWWPSRPDPEVKLIEKADNTDSNEQDNADEKETKQEESIELSEDKRYISINAD